MIALLIKIFKAFFYLKAVLKHGVEDKEKAIFFKLVVGAAVYPLVFIGLVLWVLFVLLPAVNANILDIPTLFAILGTQEITILGIVDWVTKRIEKHFPNVNEEDVSLKEPNE